ncbi:acyl-CoA dehydrogenase family protein [Brevundimonas sp. VNH65]|uniref:acyl-CoA dehydrogenase family protein n=1 Tax=Brevundimonas sp. VNH65 TaxID=3400917 RepID=UPI003C0D7FBD
MVLDDMQKIVLDTAREWTRDRMPVSAFRALRDRGEPRGYDPAIYAELGDLGWCGVAVPEAHGGSGLGYLTLALILEQMGRTVGASPLLSTAIVADALVRGGTEAVRDVWLPRLLSGQAVGALAVDEGPRHAPDAIGAVAVKTGDGWRLDGVKRFVTEGLGADLLIVAARTDDGIALFALDAGAEGLLRTPRRLTDQRGHADLTLDGVLAPEHACLAQGTGDAALIDTLLDRARALTAAELLGLAVGAFEMTVEYLKVREQFGQKIGAFQALQHRAAHLHTRLELTRSAVLAALLAIDDGSGDIPRLVALAKATASETANLATREMIQMHGGIGMTDDHDAGFYIKRARVLEATWGGAAFHRERYGRMIGV